MDIKNKSDEVLVAEYKNGDQQAFNELYSRYNKIIKYYTRNLFLLGAENEDLIQEGMLGLIRAVNEYTQGKSSFKTFATACVRNSLFTAVKKSAGNNNKVLNDSSSLDELSETGHFAILSATPEDEVIDNEKIKELREKIYSSLSKRESEVLSLYLRGLTYAEIAEKTGKTVKAVDGILARSKLKIKNCIGD